MTPDPQPTHDIASLATEIADEFAFLDDWEQRYAHVIDLGKSLAPLADHERTEANLVRGCASQVWLVSEHGEADQILFRGQSDSLLVGGLVALLTRLLSGQPAQAILDFDVAGFLSEIGVAEALTSQRANGLASMVARIRADAGRVNATERP